MEQHLGGAAYVLAGEAVVIWPSFHSGRRSGVRHVGDATVVRASSTDPEEQTSMRVFSSLDEVADGRPHRDRHRPTGSRSSRSGSTCSPTPPTTTSGSTSTSSGRTPGPFGGPIAHGYLTLSLLPYLGSQVIAFETPGASLNYGLNKVRFPHPVRVGCRSAARVTIGEVTDLPTGKQVALGYTIEIEGQAKPACVAEMVVLLLP